jgi:hypothetical protein
MLSINLAGGRSGRLVEYQPPKSRFAKTQARRSDVMTDPVLIVGAGPTGRERVPRLKNSRSDVAAVAAYRRQIVKRGV